MIPLGHLVIWFFLLVRSFPALLISHVMPQAVPCLMYRPSHAWATLPTQVSLQPTTIEWTAQLLVTDQHLNNVACLRLDLVRGQVLVRFYHDNCRERMIYNAKWSNELFGTNLWKHIDFSFQQKLTVSILDKTWTTLLSKDLNALSDKLFVYVQHDSTVSTYFNCPDQCYFHQTPISSKSKKVASIKKSSRFSVYPRSDTFSISFRPIVIKPLGGAVPTEISTLD